jgi:hypothetical protein
MNFCFENITWTLYRSCENLGAVSSIDFGDLDLRRSLINRLLSDNNEKGSTLEKARRLQRETRSSGKQTRSSRLVTYGCQMLSPLLSQQSIYVIKPPYLFFRPISCPQPSFRGW